MPRGTRNHWDRLLPKLDAMGVLSQVDASALGRYCERLDAWHQMRSKRISNFEDSLRISTHLLRLEREFGLTPSARGSMGNLSIGQKDSKYGNSKDARERRSYLSV